MSEVKPREFWVDPEEHSYITEDDRDWPCGSCFNYEYADTIRVVEYSAYLKAINAFNKAIEALKSICGNRCAHQNPCEAKEALIELGEV